MELYPYSRTRADYQDSVLKQLRVYPMSPVIGSFVLNSLVQVKAMMLVSVQGKGTVDTSPHHRLIARELVLLPRAVQAYLRLQLSSLSLSLTMPLAPQLPPPARHPACLALQVGAAVPGTRRRAAATPMT